MESKSGHSLRLGVFPGTVLQEVAWHQEISPLYTFKEKPRKSFLQRVCFHSPQQSFMLLRNPVFAPPATLPPTIEPDGLAEERKTYLYREIRPFCKPGTEDIVALAP